jgi:hypothetical protein
MFAKVVPRPGLDAPFVENSPIRGKIADHLIAKRIVDILWYFDFMAPIKYGALVGVLKREFPDMEMDRDKVHRIILSQILRTPDHSALVNLDGDGFRSTWPKAKADPLVEPPTSVSQNSGVSEIPKPQKASGRVVAARLYELHTANPELYLEDLVEKNLSKEFPNNSMGFYSLRRLISKFIHPTHPDFLIHSRPGVTPIQKNRVSSNPNRLPHGQGPIVAARASKLRDAEPGLLWADLLDRIAPEFSFTLTIKSLKNAVDRERLKKRSPEPSD